MHCGNPLVLPDPRTRRETLDWLRGDLEKMGTETDLASGLTPSTPKQLPDAN